jgi:hypothetical protein
MLLDPQSDHPRNLLLERQGPPARPLALSRAAPDRGVEGLLLVSDRDVTRAEFIDKYLDALGNTEFGEI